MRFDLEEAVLRLSHCFLDNPTRNQRAPAHTHTHTLSLFFSLSLFLSLFLSLSTSLSLSLSSSSTSLQQQTLRSDYNKFTESVPEFQTAFEALTELNKDMSEHGSTENPYSPHSFDALAEGWQQVQELVAQRATELSAEADKQASREALRTKWAAAAKESQEVRGMFADALLWGVACLLFWHACTI